MRRAPFRWTDGWTDGHRRLGKLATTQHSHQDDGQDIGQYDRQYAGWTPHLPCSVLWLVRYVRLRNPLSFTSVTWGPVANPSPGSSAAYDLAC